MKFIYIKLPKCHIYLTQKEITTLLHQNPEIFKAALARGKTFRRSKDIRNRIDKKIEQEKNNFNL